MKSFFLFFVSFLSFLFVASAQGRSPHGLAYESPMVLSPSAFEFFHPTSSSSSPNADSPCVTSDCAPLPLSSFSSSSSVAKSSLAHESRLSTSSTNGNRLGVGGIVGILFGFVVVVLLAMGVYYVVVTRQTNTSRANSVQPDV
ncbi:hypothetical protein IFM89_002588 [Coptis chinensis]|uniref:Transmembrane protein n=1 Tax=Coptis chinensis TaxID=261450 RepID=A0A835HC07_9MAGN|nr:hypothetical protein IFM89_002588 [Coptis chinensis]